MNTTKSPSELDQLKKRVADHEHEVQDLVQHLGVERFEDGKKNVNILCSAITLFSPDNPHQMQGCLAGGPDGPELSLWGSADKPRIKVSVDKDGIPSIQLFQTEEKLAIHIGQDNLGLPSVAVLDNGQPRAAIKASEAAGIVSAVHNGGQARVTMLSHESSGEILLVNPDMKVAVKLSTQGQHDEGFITVNHSNGKAAVILSALPDHGCVMVNDRAGRMKYSLPGPKDI
jgi:hypothetical protein